MDAIAFPLGTLGIIFLFLTTLFVENIINVHMLCYDSYSLPLWLHPELGVDFSSTFTVAELLTLHGVSSSVDSYHLGCDTILLGEQFTAFQRIVVPLHSGSGSRRRVVAQDNGVCHVPKGRGLQQIPT